MTCSPTHATKAGQVYLALRKKARAERPASGSRLRPLSTPLDECRR